MGAAKVRRFWGIQRKSEHALQHMPDSRKLIGKSSICLATLAFSATGCASLEPTSMTYESCAAARFCTIRGTVTAEPAAHAVMGRLDLGDGTCVSVSLPRAQIADLRRTGPRIMTVRGRVYGEPPADRVVIMEIQGRKIGLGLCGDFFVFVQG